MFSTFVSLIGFSSGLNVFQMPRRTQSPNVGRNIMRVFLTITLLVNISLSFGQTFRFPISKKTGKNISELIPPNWFLKDSCVGDLNNDNIPDLALVIEYKDTIDEIRPDSSTNNGSPRILLVYFKNIRSGNFDQVIQNNTFIYRYGEGGMSREPYGKIDIKNKILIISYLFTRSHADYKFRYQQKDFYLIAI